MTSSLTVSACDADSGTLSADHAQAELAGCFIGLDSLNTGAELSNLSGIMLVLPVLELNVLKVVCPDRKSTSASGLSVVAKKSQ